WAMSKPADIEANEARVDFMRAGALNMVTMSHMTGLVKETAKAGRLLPAMLPAVSEEYSAKATSAKIEAAVETTRGRKGQARLFRALLHVFRRPLVLMAPIIAVAFATMVLSSVVIKEVVTYTEDEDRDSGHNNIWYWVAASFLLPFLNNVCFRVFEFLSYRMISVCKGGLTDILYRKLICISEVTRQKASAGNLTNLMFSDAERASMVYRMLHVLWAAPITLFAGLSMIVNGIGWVGLSGFGVFLVIAPIQGLAFQQMMRARKNIMLHSDERVRRVSEILSGVKVVKMAGSEGVMLERVASARRKEMKWVRHIGYSRAVMMAFMVTLTPLAGAMVFSIFSATGNALTPAIVYYTISLFGNLDFPLMMLPMALSSFVEAKVSCKRIATFLALPEADVETAPSDGETAICVRNGTFSWAIEGETDIPEALKEKKEKEEEKVEGKEEKGAGAVEVEPPLVTQGALEEGAPALNDVAVDLAAVGEPDLTRPVLHGVSFSVQRGEVLGIAGKTGCGKTSLLASLLNEMRCVEGTSHVSGSVAYCAQKATIFNDTLRSNVLFGCEYDAIRYNRVLDACCLRPDIAQLQAGDLTEIGERGVTLSGGQKQRIALARAVYSDSDVYLLDDPLSAVDAHVGRSLWEDVLIGILKAEGKTVVLVTHQVQYLPECDRVILMEDGRVSFMGTYQTMMGSEDAQESMRHLSSADCATCLEEPSDAQPADAKGSKQDGTLGVAEASETGSVDPALYWKYLLSGGTKQTLITMVVVTLIGNSFSAVSDLFLGYWASDAGQLRSTHTMIALYVVVVLLAVAFSFVTQVVLVRFFVKASAEVHMRLMKRILQAPMSFFDTTPLGRILNRFSKDTDSIDSQIPDHFSGFLLSCLAVTVMVVTVIGIVPVTVVVFIPCLVLYVRYFIMYRTIAREITRLRAVTRSPVLSLASETLGGLRTIRAYTQNKRFIDEQRRRIDVNTAAYFPSMMAGSWIQYRTELIGALITLGTSAAAVLMANSAYSIAALAGLAISYSSGLSEMFSHGLEAFVELESEMSSVERVFAYIEDLDQEEPERVQARLLGQDVNDDLPEEWPQRGELSFDGVQMRYRSDLPLVLKDVSFSVRPGEKVGVVGRTGAGKSSLGVALLRLAEVEGGTVELDGVDLASLALSDVRSRISSIPQDAFLFAGSIRANLCPLHQLVAETGKGVPDVAPTQDHIMWDALSRVQLQSFVEANGGLDMVLTDNGCNLSEGQRQLVCMARALVEDNKVILIDEATASVDPETDTAIQATIRDVMQDKTLLVIAHRLQTIIDFDRILVMDDGCVAEYDTPANLLRAGGIFHSLVDQTGPEMSAELARLALEAERG
ncbi:hypothetical protein KIPB_001572, partial [Kipferlia bialata]